MGPTSKSLSLSPDVSDPGFRSYTFDQMREAYREQAEALFHGGADLLLIETCFDALNVKAALSAIQELSNQKAAETGCEITPIPVIVSVSVGDRSGRTLTGQTLKAFYTSISHYPLEVGNHHVVGLEHGIGHRVEVLEGGGVELLLVDVLA